ncbi:hypothetical protein D9M71_822670 [compost metagenome]
MQQMLGLPPGMRTDAAAVLQCAEKGMTQKRLIIRHQGIPGVRRYIGQTFQTLQRHHFLPHFLA